MHFALLVFLHDFLYSTTMSGIVCLSVQVNRLCDKRNKTDAILSETSTKEQFQRKAQSQHVHI